MLIQCSVCKRIRKFGQWIKAPETLITDSNIPIKFILCDDCKGINGGCEKLRRLEKKFNIYDKIISILVLCTSLGIIILSITFLQRWANS